MSALAVSLALLLSQSAPPPAASAAAAQAPAPKAPAPFVAGPSIEGVAEYRLPNGLKLLLVPDESRPKVTVNLTVLVGSRHEGYGEKGMAHLLEHLLFKGTPRERDPKTALNGRGADFNGTTDFDRTNYYEMLPASDANTEWAIKFEADRLVNAFVDKKDLDTEMTVVRNEFEGSENRGPFVLRSRVRAAALPWHNYGRAVIGTRADIERVPIENLKAFYKRHYRPDNAVLIVAGRFDATKVLKWVGESFGKLRRPPQPLGSTFTEEPTQDGERHVTVRRTGGSPVYVASWRIPAASSPDFPALMVLQGVLGDVPQGRLHQVLVEGKKAAQAGCDLDELREPGLFTCSATLRADNALGETGPALLAAAEQLAKTPPTEAEVERSRTAWLSQFDNALDSSEHVALYLSEWEAIGDWRMFFVQRDRLKAVTVDDVRRVAVTYFKPQNRTSGEYVPTERPDRADIPPPADVAALVKDYRGGPPVARGEAFDPSPENVDRRTQRSVLANGARLALLPKKTRAETVSLAVRLRAGTAASLKGKRELAAVTTRLLERGTRTLSYKAFQSRLEALKAQLRVHPTAQGALITLDVKRPELAAAVELLAEMLQAPALDAGELDVLKRSLQSQLEQLKNEPRALGPIELARTLQPLGADHPRATRTIPEQLAELAAITVEQVRAFHAQHLGAQSADVAVVGDFDPEALRAKLDATLGRWTAKEPYAAAPLPFQPVAAGAKELATPDKAQAWIGAGLPLQLDDDDDDYALLVLADVAFGGNPAARLFESLREKQGLSYGAYSDLSAPIAGTGDGGVFTSFAIYAPQNLARVEAALRKEFERLAAEGLTAQELERARTFLLEQREQDRADDGRLAATLAAQGEHQRTMAWEARLDARYRTATLAQVNAAIKRRISPSSLVVVKAGDFKAQAAKR